MVCSNVQVYILILVNFSKEILDGTLSQRNCLKPDKRSIDPMEFPPRPPSHWLISFPFVQSISIFHTNTVPYKHLLYIVVQASDQLGSVGQGQVGEKENRHFKRYHIFNQNHN